MSHSNDTINKIVRIMDRHARGITQGDFVMMKESQDDLVNMIANLEIAECQKGKDIIKEEIGDIILRVEKNNDPNDVKYWENMYCELRNAIVRIDTAL